MKKTIYIIALTLIAMTTKAQITFENSYLGTGQLKMVNLSVSGYKYCLSDNTLNQLRLYNLNHSLWKTINLHIPSGSIGNFIYTLVSEKLFNLDNLVEVLYVVPFGVPNDSLFIINETGNISFRVLTFLGDYSIINDGVNFKMRIQNTSGSQDIYGLTGSLPCDLCGGTMGISEPNSNGNKQMTSNPFPNPTNDRTTINYELPEGVNEGKLVFYNVTGNLVKEFKVDRMFKDIEVSNADLSAGTYYYEMQTSKGTSGGKKLVVVK